MLGRRWSFGIVTLAIASMLVVGPTSPVSAAVTIPDGAPPPINGLPSVVQGSLPVSGGTPAQNYLAVNLYKLSKSPGFWQAAAAVQAGTATSAQAATVSSVTSTHTMPGTKLATAGKIIGGVGTAISGFTIGTQIGNGIMEIAGVDVNGLVCAQDAAVFLAILTGADCSPMTFDPAYPINNGVVGNVITGGWSCNPAVPTNCLRLIGYVGSKNAAIGSGGGLYYLFEWQGTTPAGISHAINLSWPGLVATSAGPGGVPSIGTQLFGGSNITAGNISGAITPCLIANLPSNQRCMQIVQTLAPNGYQVSTSDVTGTIAAGAKLLQYRWFSQPSSPLQSSSLSSSDPARTLRCVILGDNGSTYTASTASYTEATAGALPAPNCPDLPPGVLMTKTTLWEDVAGGASTKIWEEETTPEWDAAQTLAPECISGTCMLDLQITSTGVSCFQTPTSCAAWFADPNKDSTYSCKYGTHAVDLAECNVYAPTFTEDAARTGDWYADPDGNPIGAPAGAPNPGVDGSTFQQPGQDPTTDRECFPTGWAAFNPVEWIFRPVQCALEWAFVPRASVVQAAAAGVPAAWDASFFGSVGPLVAPFTTLPIYDGCDGVDIFIEFDWPIDWVIDWNFGEACTGPLNTTAQTVRAVLGVGIVLLSIRTLTAYFGGVIAFRGFGGGGPA